MKKSIILELLHNGMSDYMENTTLFKNEEYVRYNSAFYALIDALGKAVSEDEAQEIINDLLDTLGNMESIAADEYFERGFKLGLMLAAQNFLD